MAKDSTTGYVTKINFQGGPDIFYPAGRGVEEKIGILQKLCRIKKED